MGSESDVAAWARTHGAGFEVAPLIEQVRGRRLTELGIPEGGPRSR